MDHKLPVISVREYRNIMNDRISSDVQILRRLQYLESLCRNIIKQELAVFSKSTRHGWK